MIGEIILLATLFFGVLAVFSRDNVYSAASLAAAAGAVGAYYIYIMQFAPAFLLFVIYIGAVMLLVIMTAAMYGGAQKRGGRYVLATTLVFLFAAVLGVLAFYAPPTTPVLVQTGDLVSIVIMLLGVAAVSLVVGIEVARRT